jgi:hypothetical protein
MFFGIFRLFYPELTRIAPIAPGKFARWQYTSTRTTRLPARNPGRGDVRRRTRRLKLCAPIALAFRKREPLTPVDHQLWGLSESRQQFRECVFPLRLRSFGKT